MTSRRAVLVGLIGWVAVACGGPPKAPEPYTAPLTAPWTAMALPVADGRVVYSDESLLSVHFEGGDVAALTQHFGGALEAAGYNKATDTSAADMTSITYESADAIYALGVVKTGERATVSVTRYEK